MKRKENTKARSVYGRIKRQLDEEEGGEEKAWFMRASPKADLALGSENTHSRTQKSQSMKIIGLVSENPTSQLKVSKLCIFVALYPILKNSFPQ